MKNLIKYVILIILFAHCALFAQNRDSLLKFVFMGLNPNSAHKTICNELRADKRFSEDVFKQEGNLGYNGLQEYRYFGKYLDTGITINTPDSIRVFVVAMGEEFIKIPNSKLREVKPTHTSFVFEYCYSDKDEMERSYVALVAGIRALDKKYTFTEDEGGGGWAKADGCEVSDSNGQFLSIYHVNYGPTDYRLQLGHLAIFK